MVIEIPPKNFTQNMFPPEMRDAKAIYSLMKSLSTEQSLPMVSEIFLKDFLLVVSYTTNVIDYENNQTLLAHLANPTIQDYYGIHRYISLHRAYFTSKWVVEVLESATPPRSLVGVRCSATKQTDFEIRILWISQATGSLRQPDQKFTIDAPLILTYEESENFIGSTEYTI